MSVLVIESSPIMRKLVQAYLARAQYDVRVAASSRSAQAILQEESILLVVTAWPMPGFGGVELVRSIRAYYDRNYVYIILLGRADSQNELIRGLDAGADDYLIKPLNLKELRRRIILGTRIRKLEDSFKQAQYERDMLQTHDHVTGLINRQAVYERTAAELLRYERAGKHFSLVVLDVDQMSDLYLSYGYTIGHQALRLVGDTIVATIRQNDWIGRWNPTELLLALPETSLPTACAVAERVRSQVSAIELPLPNSKKVRLSVSLGVASTSIGVPLTIDTLTQHAEQALAQAIQQGRNRVYRFDNGKGTRYGGGGTSAR